MKKKDSIRFQINSLYNEEIHVCENYEEFECGEICKIKLESMGLEKEQPVRAYLKLQEKPEKMTAMYMYNPWWTRPTFPVSFKEIPKGTQVLFLKFKEQYVCLLPMVGEKFKSFLTEGTEDELCFEMTAYIEGLCKVNEPLYIMAKDKSMYGAVHKVFEKVSTYKGICLRQERRLPEMFRYLGWCSWDAFYTDITEKKVREKAKELKQKKVPVRWMLMDDGWMSVTEKCLDAYEPDKNKFPKGFSQMIHDIRKENNVSWFGVWHTLAGYWDGVKPNSMLAKKEEDYLKETAHGLLLPSPQNGTKFFVDWYMYLKSQGIDFTKVDGQSNIRSHYEDTMAVSEAARETNFALESASLWMNGAIINCMGMAMENILARPNTALSRNSDDFFPEKEEGFVEHLLQNAYNAIYHDEIYYCDWDMFWTKHPDSKKHSFLRAISGSPLYFSDRIGETNPDILSPLVYLDGEVIMMNKSAKPTEDCIFMNPLSEGIVKLMNTGNFGRKYIAGGVAAFNLTKKEKDTSFMPCDIDGLSRAEEYWIYDYFRKNVSKVKEHESYHIKLSPDEYGWYLVFPKEGAHACIGLSDKYVGFMAIEDLKEKGTKSSVILKEKGSINWLSETEPEKVIVDGEDLSNKIQKKSHYLYELALPVEKGKAAVHVEWKK